MGWIVGIKPVGVSEDRPLDQFLSESSDKQSKVSHKRFRPMGFKSEVDAKIPVFVGIEMGIREADCMES